MQKSMYYEKWVGHYASFPPRRSVKKEKNTGDNPALPLGSYGTTAVAINGDPMDGTKASRHTPFQI